MSSTTGQTLEIWQHKGYGIFELDEDALGRILLDNRVRNKKVMVVSVGGWTERGNSFLLNVFLKYLQNPGKPDWMVNPDVPMNGFKWKWVHKTLGFYMWSEPFFITTPSGDEICVILMDTQGITVPYDKTSPESDKICIFSLLVSSVHLFSTFQVHTTEAQLKYVVNYAKLALDVFKRKPYQTFYFLIRDCGRQPFAFPLGFMYDEDLMTELKKMELPIPDCFENLHCYAMPYPSRNIFMNAYQGHLSEIDPEFKKSLKVLTEHLFDPENVVIKEINGKQVTGLELFLYIKSYCKVLQRNPFQLSAWTEAANGVVTLIDAGRMRSIPYLLSNDFEKIMYDKISKIDIPEPRSLIEATKEAMDMIAETKDVYVSKLLGLTETNEEKAWDMIAMDKAVAFYRRKMNEFMHGKDLYRINGLLLKAYHHVCYSSAINKLRRMGVENKTFDDELRNKLRKLYHDLVMEFKYYEADLNKIRSEKTSGGSSKMTVSAKDDVEEFKSILQAIQEINVQPAVSRDKKSN